MKAPRTDLRNVAIIAHVDHGKTTLVDQMLRQSGQFRESELARQDCILDSNDLERERGITILAKNIALRLGGTKINIIDTPGHADFGGEVERVLKMADGCLLAGRRRRGAAAADALRAAQGVRSAGCKPIVVINKIDRPDARLTEVLNAVFDLFVELGADDATLDFPGHLRLRPAGRRHHRPERCPAKDLKPLFDAILEARAAARGGPRRAAADAGRRRSTTATTSAASRIGRVNAGKIRKGQRIALLKRDGERIDDNGRPASRSSTASAAPRSTRWPPATSAPWSAWRRRHRRHHRRHRQRRSPCRRSRSTSRRWT